LLQVVAVEQAQLVMVKVVVELVVIVLQHVFL
jgi:hypothetical protein